MCETLDTRIIHPQLTPNLYKILTEQITFDNYYVPVYQQGATLNSEFMAQVGMLPVTDVGYRADFGYYYGQNDFSAYSLPGQLKNFGYNTYYFINNPGISYNRNILMPNYGFETAKFLEDLQTAGLPASRNDRDIMGFFDTYVDFGQRFFVAVSTMSMHGGDDKKSGPDVDFVKGLFPGLDAAVVSYFVKAMEFDNFIGLLLDRLEAEGVSDNTLIVFYPDHYNYEERKLYEYLDIDIFDKSVVHRQTLMMYAGGAGKALIEDYMRDKAFVGSTIDIAPTVLNLLTGGGDYTYFTGSDIFDRKSIVFFPDLTVTDGYNWLTVDGKYTGADGGREKLEADFLNLLKIYDYQRALFSLNYFNASFV